MKTLARITVLFTILVSTTSCMIGDFGIKGNGNVISEDRKISADFNEIKVSQGITVYLTQGNKTDLSVEADENIMDLLVTEAEGNTLKIYFDKNVNRATKKVYLTAKEVNSIKTSSGASVKGENTLNTTAIVLKSSSGSSIKLNLNAESVSSSSSSGSTIKLSGTTTNFEADASSGSSIHANNLKAEVGDAQVSSGASIDIYASDKLKARASSGGSIDYSGSPKSVDKSKSSGGSVSRN